MALRSPTIGTHYAAGAGRTPFACVVVNWIGTGLELKKPSAGGARGAGGKDNKTVKTKKAAQNPGWASGLRQLYDSVVDEPLPDTFKDLLSQLDRKS